LAQGDMVIKISARMPSYRRPIDFSFLLTSFISESSKDFKTTFRKTLFLVCNKLEHLYMQKGVTGFKTCVNNCQLFSVGVLF
jgi:hypothetical protein